MTLNELNTKISESSEDKWYFSVQVTFNFPYINFIRKFEGVSSIYEFVSQQVSGWEKQVNIPYLSYSKDYFMDIRNNIIQLINPTITNNRNSLDSLWLNIAKKISEIQGFPFLFNCPETEFLIKVRENYPNALEGAFKFITKTNIENITDKNFLTGTLLAYEFTLKDFSKITERRNAEELSISNIRNDFQNYLTISEQNLAENLKKSNERILDSVNASMALLKERDISFNDWFEKSKLEFTTLNNETRTKINDLENTYEELLRLKKPAEYWSSRASVLKKEGWKSLYWLVGLVVFACLALYSLLWLTPEGMLKTFFNNDKSTAIRWSIIFITFISFLAYGIKALTKVLFSSFHLARDAEEREHLTYVYLAMIKDASIEKEDRHLIMQSLFSRADTGLLKDDSAPTMPSNGNLIDKITQR